jgi:hypothetical protein
MCAQGMVNRGNRFCSNRRRDYYDAGNAGFRQDWLRSKPDYGITGWKVAAGPPGIKIGSEYYKPLRDAIERCKAKATREAACKAQRNKIPNYTVKANGHGYWQPSATSRFLGFTSGAGRKRVVVAENTTREAA